MAKRIIRLQGIICRIFVDFSEPSLASVIFTLKDDPRVHRMRVPNLNSILLTRIGDTISLIAEEGSFLKTVTVKEWSNRALDAELGGPGRAELFTKY